MFTLFDKAKLLLRSEDGPTATEYAVMLSLIALALITITEPLRDAWVRLYTAVGTEVGGGG